LLHKSFDSQGKIVVTEGIINMKYESTHSHSLLLNYEYKYESTPCFPSNPSSQSSLSMTKPKTGLSLSETPIHKNLRMYVPKVTNDAAINAKYNYQAFMVNMKKGMSREEKDEDQRCLYYIAAVSCVLRGMHNDIVRDMGELGIGITTYTYPDDVDESVLLHQIPDPKEIAIATGIIIFFMCRDVFPVLSPELYVEQKTKDLASTVGYSGRDVKVFREFYHAWDLIRFGSPCKSIRRSVKSAVVGLRGESGLIPKVFSYISTHLF